MTVYPTSKEHTLTPFVASHLFSFVNWDLSNGESEVYNATIHKSRSWQKWYFLSRFPSVICNLLFILFKIKMSLWWMILLIEVAMSSFRSLAPSHQHDQPSGSLPTKQGGFVWESSTSGGTSAGASGSVGDSHRRRRNAGNVSLMACNECRHARQKVRSIILTGSCLPLCKCLSMLRFV